MKTPEEFLKDYPNIGFWDSISEQDEYAKDEVIFLLKSMQEDAEKELIEFGKWYSGMEESKVVKAYKKWKEENPIQK